VSPGSTRARTTTWSSRSPSPSCSRASGRWHVARRSSGPSCCRSVISASTPRHAAPGGRGTSCRCRRRSSRCWSCSCAVPV